MNSIENIKALIDSLSAEEIKKVMAEVKAKKPKQVDTTRRARRIAITANYFSVAPRPKDDFKDYLNHSEGIRQQVLSGVDSWK